ncbi:GNAT family N-acetyltransferase [Paenarthrobacter sp. DKR-5]|uniref:GNAT family N-acetyltransferase n=1 Tax=Paenarthrobacter sp. DKR-5 TaxID=2835535 RepID=UPI001BDC0222|nr:GNAT family N-acetyltransferase [Paenarthrobacter sp. DKR-5]MBT1001591.1 GNAT family N-acetyltransferase [Paenarthrobacter sp. DKR-5]
MLPIQDSVHIRDATLSDNVGICRLMAEWPQGSAATAAATGAGTVKVRRVAECNGEIVGLLVGHHHFNGWRMLAGYADTPPHVTGSLITELYVRPDCRRAGIGRALIASFIEESAALGRKMVVAQLDESESHLPHQARVDFFRAVGFAWLTPTSAFLPAGRQLMGREPSAAL